jgi:hypothetical protein
VASARAPPKLSMNWQSISRRVARRMAALKRGFGKPPRRVSVLWLMEHLGREMDASCAVVSLLRARYGVHVEMRHIYGDATLLVRDVVPDVVVHPHFYFVKGARATEDYVACWPDAVHFNMAWEQIHYPANFTLKSPADAFTRERVLHHAWGEFHRRYLIGHGVPDSNIFVNGQPSYALYDEPYRGFVKTRCQLGDAYGLDPTARWIFVPENYRWAFLTDGRVSLFEGWGVNRAEALELRDFSRRSLATVLTWCADVARTPKLEVIFRARPVVGEDQMRAFVATVPGVAESRIRFLKRESVRDWILASDLVVSSYSTSLIEAALAGRPGLMVEPIPIPPALACDWYALVPSVTSLEEFTTACREFTEPSSALAAWARDEMLSRGDPIERLAARIAGLVALSRESVRREAALATASAARERIRPLTFNVAEYDQDLFDQSFIESRVRAWTRALGHPPVRAGSRLPGEYRQVVTRCED